MDERGRPVLYAIATGSPAARDLGRLVALAQADGWAACAITSPDGRRFVDAEALAAATGHPVRSSYKDPAEPDALPPADGMIAAPITCNSLAKWAAGISDTLPLGLLVEAVGRGLPVVAMPFSNHAQIAFPAVQEAMRRLAGWGVRVLVGDEVYPQHEPGTGSAHVHRFPWSLAWREFLRHPWHSAR